MSCAEDSLIQTGGQPLAPGATAVKPEQKKTDTKPAGVVNENRTKPQRSDEEKQCCNIL